MRTRDEILQKFAQLIAEGAGEEDVDEDEEIDLREEEFKRRLTPGFGKRKEEQYWGTPEYLPGGVGRKDTEPDVSRGYGVTKRNARLLAKENPEEYIHKHQYHLVGKLNDITFDMLNNMIEKDVMRFFKSKFDQVAELEKLFPGLNQKAIRGLKRIIHANPIEVVKSKIFVRNNLRDLLPELFGATIKAMGLRLYDLGNLSEKLKTIKDDELKSGLFDLVFFLRARQPDYFMDTSLRDDPNFGKLFEEELEKPKPEGRKITYV